jgi:hypothetical protein
VNSASPSRSLISCRRPAASALTDAMWGLRRLEKRLEAMLIAKGPFC